MNELDLAALEEYRRLDDAIRSRENGAVVMKWKFGRLIVAERGDAKQLPRGRTKQIAEACSRGVREIQNRVRVAEHYATETEVRNALRTFPTWRQLVGSTVERRREPESDEDRAAILNARARRLNELAPECPEHEEMRDEELDAVKAGLRELSRVEDADPPVVPSWPEAINAFLRAFADRIGPLPTNTPPETVKLAREAVNGLDRMRRAAKGRIDDMHGARTGEGQMGFDLAA